MMALPELYLTIIWSHQPHLFFRFQICAFLAGEKRATAYHLTHSPKTQEREYDCSIKTGQAGRMSNILRKVMTGEELTEEDMREEDACKFVELLMITAFMSI
jgi:hypothetical protein